MESMIHTSLDDAAPDGGTGRILVPIEDIQRRIFQGGLDPEIRSEVWRYLFHLFPWTSTHADRVSIKTRKSCPSTDHDAEMYRDACMRVGKDARRTDWGHPFYASRVNMDKLRDILITYACSYEESDRLAFVQGMAHLASPVLIVMEGDESDAFWSCADLMEKMKSNFSTTASGCPQASRRVTASPADRSAPPRPPGSHWWHHVLSIVRHLYTFDEVLKYVNDLSGTVPLDPTLEAAELLYTRFRVRAASVGALRAAEGEEGVHEVVTESVRRRRGREVIEAATRREEGEPGLGAEEEQRERLRKGKERERRGDKLKAR
ncbi:GTPase activating protein [Irineochytrium annulatum]|nr:GTPase activating protein [Irineochytrium annulatum]